MTLSETPVLEHWEVWSYPFVVIILKYTLILMLIPVRLQNTFLTINTWNHITVYRQIIIINKQS